MSIPLSTIKTALKIDYSDDDADLIRLRETATVFVEKRTGLALQPRTETLYLAYWTDSLIPVAPYTGITHVRYQNSTNTQTTVPAGDYWIDQTDGPLNQIRFLERPETYTVGYSNIPDPLVHAMIALVGHWYNNPEAAQPIGLQTVPMSVEAILDMYSIRSQLR
jgi:uncharacterized phiE125 gp8 family phage protein